MQSVFRKLLLVICPKPLDDIILFVCFWSLELKLPLSVVLKDPHDVVFNNASGTPALFALPKIRFRL
jgi:hypothetical protein